MFVLFRAFRRTAGARVASGPLVAAFATIAALAAHAHEFKIGSIEITHPWSRATPPGATTGAGYLGLSNEGAEADRLVGATSPAAPRVEIHEMKVETGIMRMAPVAGGVAIPPGGKVALEPGGIHLMLMNLAKPLKQGDKVPLTLRFEKAGAVDVWLLVDKMGAAGEAHRHGEGEMQ